MLDTSDMAIQTSTVEVCRPPFRSGDDATEEGGRSVVTSLGTRAIPTAQTVEEQQLLKDEILPFEVPSRRSPSCVKRCSA